MNLLGFNKWDPWCFGVGEFGLGRVGDAQVRAGCDGADRVSNSVKGGTSLVVVRY